jgi:hypothetical protein
MSIPKRSRGAFANVQSEEKFLQSVVRAIEDAGFRVHLETNRAFDLTFLAANGNRIAVECGLRAEDFGHFGRVREWLDQIRRVQNSRIKETLFVSPSFSARIREALEDYHDIAMVEYERLPEWLERYKPSP